MPHTSHRQKYPTPFREGDRVCHVSRPNEHGTFVMYCKGYLSHAIVRWDGDRPLQRIRASNLSLVPGGRNAAASL